MWKKVLLVFIAVHLMLGGAFFMMKNTLMILDMKAEPGSDIVLYYETADGYREKALVDKKIWDIKSFEKGFVFMPKDSLAHLRIALKNYDTVYRLREIVLYDQIFFPSVVRGENLRRSFEQRDGSGAYYFDGEALVYEVEGSGALIYGENSFSERIFSRYALMAELFFIAGLALWGQRRLLRRCGRLLSDACAVLADDGRRFVKFYKMRMGVLWTTFFFLTLAYGFRLFQYSLSIDSEVALFNENVWIWAAQGRYGIAVLKYLLGTVHFVPPVANFLSIVVVFFTALLWGLILSAFGGKRVRDIHLIIFNGMLITYPLSASYMNFLTFSCEVSLGCFFCAIAVYYTSRWAFGEGGRMHGVIGIVCMAFSFGVYQAMIPLYAVGIGMVFILCLFGEESAVILPVKRACERVALSLTSGIILYWLLNHIAQLISGKDAYIDNFGAWGKAPAAVVIEKLLFYYKLLYFDDLVLHGAWFTVVTGVMLFLGAYYIFIKRDKRLAGIFLWGIFLLPAAFAAALGMILPQRTQLMIPLLVAFGSFLMVYLVQRRVAGRILCGVLLLVAFYQGQAMAKLFYGEYMKYEMDVALSHKVATRIEQLGEGVIPLKPVVFVGAHQHMAKKNIVIKNKEDALGYSIFEWDSGNYIRIGFFMDSLGYSYRKPNIAQLKRGQAAAADMPSWPAAGAVAVRGDLVIVKFSQ